MARKTPEQWQDAANERVRDADVLREHRSNPVGTIYMAGYVIELHLKALWEEQGKEPPRTHDLRQLWRGVFQLAELQDRTGARSFFLNDWNTSLRYEAGMPSTYTAAELLDAAKSLAGRIRRECRRVRQGKTK